MHDARNADDMRPPAKVAVARSVHAVAGFARAARRRPWQGWSKASTLFTL